VFTKRKYCLYRESSQCTVTLLSELPLIAVRFNIEITTHLREQAAPVLSAILQPAWLPRTKFSFGTNFVYLLLHKKINKEMHKKIARNCKRTEEEQ
jgi:hypothetical protein